ncbi:dihydroneopterin aldolase [Ferviditalea candida]|uniref:7,8-dihydroneopterin aldolase n=1 Tax=Ferviditalea candida TaxID=3108399 RepID=A0ABU5ZL98_9BACL|nr:dihydroneopterin aldolase [Paenibacillaceae bacterium T2]
MDKITLQGMRFFGYHGVFPEENKLGQRFVVDLTLFADLKRAGVNDALADTVNYAEILETTRKVVEEESFQLIEAVAERIASLLLDTYTKINEITVKVTKPHPPVDAHFDGVSVEINRKRET